MDEKICYITRIVWDELNHYLLWREGQGTEDSFVLHPNGVICIVATEIEAQALSKRYGMKSLDVNEYSSFNFDLMWQCLSRTKQKRSLLKEEYKNILDSWNMIEDIARSIGLKLPPFKMGKKMIIHTIYEKIFAGADILGLGDVNIFKLNEGGISEENRCSPLSRKERAIARAYLGSAWKIIRSHKNWP